MSEMIERVGRILEPQAWAALGIGDTLAYKSRRTSSLRKARAAIEEMRTPTEAMCVAGNIPGWDDSVTVGLSEEIWSAMIGAALTE